MKAFPNVPTMRELGYDFINDTIYLIAAPKGTPEPIVKKLDDALHKAMDDPRFLDVLAKIDHEPTYRGSEETQKYLKEAWVRYGEMIKDIRMMPEGPAPKK